MSFERLPRVVAEDEAVTRVIGRSASVLAVAEPARAMAIAAMVTESERQPVLVAVPTTSDAERLAADLRLYLGADDVLVFPAWETLPFERVSPSIEAMGQRLRTLWHLQDPDQSPRVIVAPARALVQRLGPHVDEVDPIVVGIGDQLDPQQLIIDLVAMGYRREPQVEHRGEVAIRGSIVDVYPSTADAPIRIDLWGDEVDRLTHFTINDQRSSIDISEAEIFACRELLPTPDVRERAEALIASEPWGREHWQRLADGELFDGMESWLSWLTDDELVLTDLLPPDALVVLVEPRRMRDRGADLLAEEADMATTLARTWGAVADDTAIGDDDLPRLHLPFDRLLAKTTAPAISIMAVPDGPDVAVLAASGWPAPGEPLAQHIQQLLNDGARVIITADGIGSAKRVGLSTTMRECQTIATYIAETDQII